MSVVEAVKQNPLLRNVTSSARNKNLLSRREEDHLTSQKEGTATEKLPSYCDAVMCLASQVN